MNFKKGDLVQVLDDVLSGIVQKVQGTTISIETEDGFLLDYQADELIAVVSMQALKSPALTHQAVAKSISEKITKAKKKPIKTKNKSRALPPMEVDLHIHQITKSTRGMTNHDMLNLQIDTARQQLEFAIEKRLQRIVFIHGVGQGVLKLELEYLFGRYDNVSFYDADYQKYGIGAMEVYIYQNPAPTTSY